MDPVAGVVLAGGRSSRMGTPKAALEWHGSTLLYRTAALLARTVRGPVVVVRAPGQSLPPVPTGVGIAEDQVGGRGPMQGIATGLAAVADRARAAFVCATDLPLLHPAYVRRVLRELAVSGADAVVPVAGGHRQPLAAAYRTTLAGTLAGLLARGDLRLGMVARHCAVVQPDGAALLTDPELARADPRLESVLNVNTPAEYAAARSRPAPSVRVAGRAVAAATLGAAAGTLGVALDGTVVTVNGEPVDPDPELPLVAGDRVGLRLLRSSDGPHPPG